MQCLVAGETKGGLPGVSTGATPKCSAQRMPRLSGEERSLRESGRPNRRKNSSDETHVNNRDTVLNSARQVSLQTHVRSLGSAGHHLSGVTKRSILGGFSA